MKTTIIHGTALLLVCLWSIPAEATNYPLSEVLPDEDATALARAGITSTDQLLERAATPQARAKLAKTTKLTADRLLQWARMADLVRIKGVGPTMVRLLREARIQTVESFRSQDPAALAARLDEANKKTKITETPPIAEQLANWISQAKELPIVLK